MNKYEGCCPKCESEEIYTTDSEFCGTGILLIGMECQNCGHIFTGECKEVLIRNESRY